MKNPFPNIDPTVKGITLAFLATLGMANVYVFSKAALLEVNYFQFQFYWFGFALIWIVSFLTITGMIKKIPSLSRASNITLAIVGLLELLGERFNAIEAVGIIFTIAGVILITYTRDTTIGEFFGKGSGWILVSLSLYCWVP